MEREPEDMLAPDDSPEKGAEAGLTSRPPSEEERRAANEQVELEEEDEA